MSASTSNKSSKKHADNVHSETAQNEQLKQNRQENKYKDYPQGAVIYIGHVPHGFYEQQMRAYFSQFGKVGRIQLCRSRKTYKSKGYAFVEFESKDVAEIAADAMNNYLMFRKLLKCHVLPEERVHPKLFKCSVFRKHHIDPYLIHKSKHNRPQTDDKVRRSIRKTKQKKKKLLNKLEALGISYTLPQEISVKHSEDQQQVEGEDKHLMPAKRQKVGSPEKEQMPEVLTHDEKSLKKKRKLKTATLNKEEITEKQDVPPKKKKTVTPQHEKTSRTFDTPTSNTETPVRQISTEIENKSEEEKWSDHDEGDELLPRKLQKLISPKTDKTPKQADRLKKVEARTPERKAAEKKQSHNRDSDDPDDADETSLPSKEQELPTPKRKRTASQPKTPITMQSKTPDVKRSGTKVLKKMTDAPKSPVTKAAESPNINKSAKKTPKNKETEGVGEVKKHEQVVEESVLAEKIEPTSPKLKKLPSPSGTPVTAAKTPESKKSAKKTQRNVMLFSGDSEEECADEPVTATPSTPRTRGRKMQASNSALKKGKRHGEEAVESSPLTKTPLTTTPKQRQTTFTPSARVTRSAKKLDQQKTDKAMGTPLQKLMAREDTSSPSQKLRTPRKKTLTPKVKTGSMKKN